MIAYEFSTRLTDEGTVCLPKEYVNIVAAGSAVRILILVEDPVHITSNSSSHAIKKRPDHSSEIEKKTRRIRPKPKKKILEQDLQHEEVFRRLLASGFIHDPSEYDNAAAQEWRALLEEEREQPIQEMNGMYFPDSPTSQAITEGRRGSSSELTKEEAIQKLVQDGLTPQLGSSDNESARAWRNRSEEERQQLIEEMNNTFFPDSFASELISQNRR